MENRGSKLEHYADKMREILAILGWLTTLQGVPEHFFWDTWYI